MRLVQNLWRRVHRRLVQRLSLLLLNRPHLWLQLLSLQQKQRQSQLLLAVLAKPCTSRLARCAMPQALQVRQNLAIKQIGLPA